jgi:hypothetical protein
VLLGERESVGPRGSDREISMSMSASGMSSRSWTSGERGSTVDGGESGEEQGEENDEMRGRREKYMRRVTRGDGDMDMMRKWPSGPEVAIVTCFGLNGRATVTPPRGSKF